MFIFDIAQLAQKSLIYEASTYPKPGLVTPLSRGAHRDMDYRTFVDSAVALLPCYINCVSVGLELHALPPEEVLPRLREVGKLGESEMYGATNGVNTHKGAIFLIGLLCAAAGRLHSAEELLVPERVAETAASFVKGIVERELRTLRHGLTDCTSGELAYILHRVDGARGEAQRGFPSALAALNDLKSFADSPLPFREQLAHVLIAIMADNADSNLIARGGVEAMEEVRERAKAVLAAGGMLTPKGREGIEEMEKILVEKNFSPGGSADILSCAVFLWLLENDRRSVAADWAI